MSDGLASASNRIGDALRKWRQFRRLSQLDLALRAEVSTRHLSFVETGRAQPGRALIARLCEELEVPLRERNLLLLGAGFSPSFGAAKLDDPEFETIRSLMAMTLERQKPYPGFVIDRHWSVLMSNAAIPALYEGVAPKLLQGQINVVRLVLHPEGMAPRVRNLSVWRSYYTRRLRRQIELTSDPVLIQLLQEVQSYPALRAHDEVAPQWVRQFH